MPHSGHLPDIQRVSARPLLMRAVAIGDCHGQELNLRDIGLTRMEYHFLHMSGPASAHDAGGADQAKRPIARRRRGPKLAITDRA